VDIEFVSSMFLPGKNTVPVHVVFNPRQPIMSALNAASNSFIANIPFNSTAIFQDSCIDPTLINTTFCSDGSTLTKLRLAPVPATLTPRLLSQWNNDNPLWASKYYERETVVAVTSFKACFNSANATNVAKCSSCCKEGGVCKVPWPSAPVPEQTKGNNVSVTYTPPFIGKGNASVKSSHVPVAKGHLPLDQRIYINDGDDVSPGMVMMVLMIPIIVFLPLFALTIYLVAMLTGPVVLLFSFWDD
jgi:hypothetical protein